MKRYLLLLVLCTIFIQSFSNPSWAPEETEDTPDLKYRILGRYIPHHLDIIKQEIENRGFRLVNNESQWWNVTWAISFKPQNFSALDPRQRVNVIPGRQYATNKDKLHREVERMKEEYGPEHFDWWPNGLNLEVEEQFQQLRQVYIDFEKKQAETTEKLEAPIYIIKRPKLPRGKGVHLISSLEEVDFLKNPNSPCHPLNSTRPLGQEYVKDVLLLEGHKFTTRMWTVVTSFDPLRVYLFDDGLCRMSSKKYSLDTNSLKDLFVHIDSIDINQKNEKEFLDSVSGSNLEHDGMRTSFQYLLKRLQGEGVDIERLWKSVKRTSLMGWVATEPKITPEFYKQAVSQRARRLYPFEMTGLDVLIDRNYRTWLLEINGTPSMVAHNNLEIPLKSNLLGSLNDLVDLTNKDFDKLPELTEEYLKIVRTYPKGAAINAPGKTPFLLEKIRTKSDMWAIVETELEDERRKTSAPKWHRLFPSEEFAEVAKLTINKRNELMVSWVASGLTLEDLKTKAPAAKKEL